MIRKAWNCPAATQARPARAVVAENRQRHQMTIQPGRKRKAKATIQSPKEAQHSYVVVTIKRVRREILW